MQTQQSESLPAFFAGDGAFSTLEIEPGAAVAMLESGEGVIVDVRLAEELEFFAQAPGAIALPLGVIQSLAGSSVDPAYADELSSMSQKDLARLNAMLIQHAFRNTTLMVLCRSGNRSMAAVNLLRSLGYYMCYSVAGGIVEWERLGLPLIQPAE